MNHETEASITQEDLRQRLDFIGMDESGRTRLADLQETIAEVLPGVLDDFYGHIRNWSEIFRMFGGDAHIAHVKERQLQHWQTIAAGRFDQDYIDSVRKIGGAHHTRQLDPKWYIAGYALILSQLVRTLLQSKGKMKRRDEAIQAIDLLIRAVFIDMDLAISVYLDEGRKEKDRVLADLTEDFEANVGNVVDALASASNELEATAGSMANLADDSSKQSTAAAASADETTENVSTVAAAAEQMSNSIAEVASQIAASAASAGDAVVLAKGANEKVAGLVQSANEVGVVIGLITDIAEQTNLLALNATIEAARAGEAGKGFAVVAQEVKALANQTKKATEDIAAYVQDIQGATDEAVQSIRSIGEAITSIETRTSEVSAAVEEQTAVVQEISRSVQAAATGTGQVSTSIASVSQSANEVGSASEQLVGAVKELVQQNHALKRSSDDFLDKVRTA